MYHSLVEGLVKVECPQCKTIFFVKRDAFIRKSIFVSAIVFCPHCSNYISEEYVLRKIF